MIGTEFKFYLICMDRHFICIYKYLNLHTTEKGGEREEERMQERERERERVGTLLATVLKSYINLSWTISNSDCAPGTNVVKL